MMHGQKNIKFFKKATPFLKSQNIHCFLSVF